MVCRNKMSTYVDSMSKYVDSMSKLVDYFLDFLYPITVNKLQNYIG